MAKSNKSASGRKKGEKRNTQKIGSRGKTSAEIVRRHLGNRNDKITEDDLKNLKIDLTLPKDTAHKPLPLKPGKSRPKDADKDKTIITPWDVISE